MYRCWSLLGSAAYVRSGTEAAAASIFQEAGVGGCARWRSMACGSVARIQQHEILKLMGWFLSLLL